MEIRSITFFADPTKPLDTIALAVAAARTSFATAGYPLQTVRLATTPFPDWLADLDQLTGLVTWCQTAGIDYLALGPVRLGQDVAHLDQIVEMIRAHEMVFASAEVADRSGRIDAGRAWDLAGLVRRLSTVRPDGFANLYFTVTANCLPGSPFFPVSYHGGGPAAFAFAVEAAELAVSVCATAGSLSEASERLTSSVESEAARLVRLAAKLTESWGLDFGGLDFSLAPYPTAGRSLGSAMEALGLPAVGGHGSLFAAAFLAEAVQRAEFPKCGFSGLMFPVLEDAVLAKRAAEGLLTVDDLLLYSAVCGAGLDTVPLPGDVSEAELYAIFLDLAALAARLGKPLTARLMPMPGLAAGDPVIFDFPYFADSRVMAVRGLGVVGALAGREQLTLRTYQRC